MRRVVTAIAERADFLAMHPFTGDAEATCEITLTKGYVAKVDAIDFAWLSQWCWSVVGPTRLGAATYARRGLWTGQHIPMHRVVVGAQAGEVVDHINYDGLDNRRRNLRKCTVGQNLAHARIAVGCSGYRGVKPGKVVGRFVASIALHRKRQHLGTFPSAKAAALAYDIAARELHGPFAVLNFPDEAEAA